jgi:transglutaminase-like putative cysteine protease
METYIANPKSLENQEIMGDIFYNPKPDGFEIDRWGQEVAIFNYTLFPDQEITLSFELNTSIYTIRYILLPWKVKGEIPEEILNKYTADDTLYKINDTYIQDIIKDVIGNTKNILFKAIKLHDYVINNLEYYNNWYWDDAVTTLKRGNGSCSDYCFAYIALCRAAGIPARYKGCTLLNGRMPYYDVFFHRIVEIYLPGYDWVPVDPTLNDFQKIFRHFFFGYISNNLFVLTVGGGSSEFLGWSYHYWHKNSSQDGNITTDCNMKLSRIKGYDF